MNRPFALVPLAVIALSGCTRAPTTPPASGEATVLRCDAPGAGDRVYIDIAYAPDGMPMAMPDTCTVASRTNVEWRGPDGNSQAFDIRFKNANPVPSAPDGQLHSKAGRARQQAWGDVQAAPGRYDYAIRAGSKERDPAIIIR
ncbi:hypothetical protein [Cognatilysobacter lacus]|uniref:Uncharacterized protein n=1 Tax=Cognatilysobacter lacus TaxID=1643323 RepID=A0A5D8Z8C2_9GAMM|nr:hypothetical protein [Lysobacter lacus]TZF91165.1 hypothetical protein FW784_02740 [Lysobacter lacus]